MGAEDRFTREAAADIAERLGIDWDTSPFDLEQFRFGLEIELEHGTRDPDTDVTGDDPLVTGKIALAHLRELPDYYTRLAAMEAAPYALVGEGSGGPAAQPASAASLLLDGLLPAFDATRIEHRVVPGDLGTVFEAVLDADFMQAWKDSLAVRTLVFARGIAERAVGAFRSGRGRRLHRRLP
jgi:hypothetical protein